MKKQNLQKCNPSHPVLDTGSLALDPVSSTGCGDVDKRGFTLVELSIVLVIIGLLIGGILVGQSLIESAKMQSFVRQIAQYDALAASFKSKFRALPGDATVFGCTPNLAGSGNVCNNGTIEAIFSDPNYYFFSESSLYWKHLSDSGFRPSGVSYIPTLTNNTIAPDVNVPKAQIGTAGIVVASVAGINTYFVAGYSNLAEINAAGGLSALDSLAFDAKTDDGNAVTGNVVVGLATANADCNNADDYNIVDGTGLVCALAIRHMSGISF